MTHLYTLLIMVPLQNCLPAVYGCCLNVTLASGLAKIKY